MAPARDSRQWAYCPNRHGPNNMVSLVVPRSARPSRSRGAEEFASRRRWPCAQIRPRAGWQRSACTASSNCGTAAEYGCCRRRARGQTRRITAVNAMALVRPVGHGVYPTPGGAPSHGLYPAVDGGTWTPMLTPRHDRCGRSHPPASGRRHVVACDGFLLRPGMF
jgi:hypothetical protein